MNAVTDNLEDSLYIKSSEPTRIYTNRPGTYEIETYINYNSGVPSTQLSSVGGIMTMLAQFSNGTGSEGLSKFLWQVTAE